MNDLLNLQQAQIEALQKRNAYLESENINLNSRLKKAEGLFQEFINEFEVIEPEIL
jgi:cupin superfamily acireductone dioxygenase involved in methionine salvage